MSSDNSLFVGEDVTQRILHRVQLCRTSLSKRTVPCRDWLWITPLFCTITKGASSVCRSAACIRILTKYPPKGMAIMQHCRPLPALNQLVVGHQVTDTGNWVVVWLVVYYSLFQLLHVDGRVPCFSRKSWIGATKYMV